VKILIASGYCPSQPVMRGNHDDALRALSWGIAPIDTYLKLEKSNNRYLTAKRV
jgi:hypothetical protein